MTKWVIALAVAPTLAFVSPCQVAAQNSSYLTLNLSSEVRSESVTIVYYLYGAFGAAGQAVQPQKDVHSYEIPTSYRGTAAEKVRLIAYVPGCQFQIFNVSLTGGSTNQETIQCSALPTVRIVGEITPHRLVQKPWEIVIYYEAYWGCHFFQLSDCQVPQFPLVTAPIHEDGSFEITLPDFSVDTQTSEHEGAAELQTLVRNSKTWNAAGFELIAPAEYKRGPGALAIRSYYPNPLQFNLKPQS